MIQCVRGLEDIKNICRIFKIYIQYDTFYIITKQQIQNLRIRSPYFKSVKLYAISHYNCQGKIENNYL